MLGGPRFYSGAFKVIEMKLRQMKKNQPGIIARVTAAKEIGRRIRDMELVPGSKGYY